MRDFTWATYPLAASSQQMKDSILRTYKSQRPYTTLLRNAFVRKNELFLVYPEEAAATARIPIAAR